MSYHSIPGSGFHYLNSPFGDTTFTKVFVGGLAWETQSHTLRRHFEPFGDILEAVVITDNNTGRSKGYGFVSSLLSSVCFFIAASSEQTSSAFHHQTKKTSSACIVCALEINWVLSNSFGNNTVLGAFRYYMFR